MSLTVTHSTFVIERTYPTTPDRVFAAFSDPAKKRRWFGGDEGARLEEFQMDFRVGRHRAPPVPRSKGSDGRSRVHQHTTYQDIVPDRRIVLAYTMSAGDDRISASLATFEFLPTEDGTKLVFTEQAAFFEGADGPQMREAGWRHLLEALAKQC